MESSTSWQQARWFVLDSPAAESYWSDAEIVYCTAESYVPARKARLAVTLHDAAYLEQGVHRWSISVEQQRLKWKCLYRTLIRKADMFQTVSEFSAERLTHFLPELRDRIKVVPNAVAPHFFSPVTEEGHEFLVSAGLSHKAFILVPGGLHFRKNAELILAAWPLVRKHCPELILVVVNHSDPYYSAQAQAMGASVKQLGFVSDEGLRALYSAAQLVWFPSRYEGFGLPVIEAMACGAAVVASDATSLPEISGGCALLVSPNRPKSHVDALVMLLSDSRMRKDMQERGAQHAAAFTWERSADQLMTYFGALI